MESEKDSNQNSSLDIHHDRWQPLTEKYRPKSFDEVIGNSAVVERLKVLTTTMKGSVRNFLLFGPSGVGKTSIGEILIEKIESVETGFRGVYRYNTADLRGIDTIREVIKRTYYSGMRLFFFDEAHRLTPEAQDALLKPLQGHRSDVFFIFSTTDPDKLNIPLKSRCENFKLKPLSENDSLELIDRVCDGEGKSLTEDDKNIMNIISKGIPRDIVNNVGKAIYDPKFFENLYDSESMTLYNSYDKFIVPFRKFYDLKLPERQMILSPWLLEGDLVMLAADSGTGKSLFAMEISAACSTGRKAMDGLWTPVKSCSVLYIDGEMHWDDIKSRGRLFELWDGLIFSKTFYSYRKASPPLYITDEEIRNFLLDYIVKTKIRLLILDNIDSLCYNLDLSSATQWSPIKHWLTELRSHGVAVIIVHHTNKKGSPHGTSARRFNLDYSFILQEQPSYFRPNSARCVFSIEVDKVRRGLEELEQKLFICENGKWDVRNLDHLNEKKQRGRKEDEASKEKKAKIALGLVEGKKQKDIAEDEEVSPEYVSIIKGKLIKKGLIQKIKGFKSYELTEIGKNWIE